MICSAVLVPVIGVIRTFIRIVREIVRTVCELVTTTIRTLKEVCEEVCGWLGPFSFLCDWVCKVIEVVETITEWVCTEVIDRIISWVEVVLEYVYYILKWICWVVDWILVRWLEMLLCSLGVRPRKFMRVCVRILNDPENGPAVTVEQVRIMMADAARILARCDIQLVVEDVAFLDLPEFMTTTGCDFGSMFSRFWLTFNELACASRIAEVQPIITVYFVESMSNAGGCAFPGTDWVIVANPANGGDGTVVVQEIGHLCDIWPHSDDPNNVMTDQPGGTHDQITAGQCCIIRSSRFATLSPPLRLVRRELTDLAAGVTVELIRSDRGRG